MTSLRIALNEAKQQARELREALAAKGTLIGHSKALEMIAQQHGYRDWNTLYAAIGKRQVTNLLPGTRCQGRYLSQSFKATVLVVEHLQPGWVRLELDLDEPIDTVGFDSFSNFRKRIRGTVGPKGVSRECTSDGRPHLEIEM